MIVLGIDIGLTGAIAVIDATGSCQVHDLPRLTDNSEHMRLDGYRLFNLLRNFERPGEQALVVAENVQPRPQGNSNRHGNSMHSQGSMMQSKGIVLATVDIARLDLQLVTPQAWKKFYGLTGQEKAASMLKAQQLYPEADLRLVKHHNRAEALLMAHFGIKKLVTA